MGHKVAINNNGSLVSKEIVGGKAMVDGKVVNILYGKTKVNGNIYEIPFIQNLKLVLTGDMNGSIVRVKTLNLETSQDITTGGTYEFEDVVSVLVLGYGEYYIYVNGNLESSQTEPDSTFNAFKSLSSNDGNIPMFGTITMDFSWDISLDTGNAITYVSITCKEEFATNNLNVFAIETNNIDITSGLSITVDSEEIDSVVINSNGRHVIEYTGEQEISLIGKKGGGLYGWKGSYYAGDVHLSNMEQINSSVRIDPEPGRVYYVTYTTRHTSSGIMTYTIYDVEVVDDTYYGKTS